MKTLTVKSNGWYWEFKEGEIRYIGKPINNKKIGKLILKTLKLIAKG